jgi:hypothetical protein
LKREKARQAFFGFARWNVDDIRPAVISRIAMMPEIRMVRWESSARPNTWKMASRVIRP